MLNQLHIVPDIVVNSGGRAMAALRYAEALSRSGSHVTLFVASSPTEHSFKTSFESPTFRLIKPQFDAKHPTDLITQFKAIDALCYQNRFDLIHLQGFWLPIFCLGSVVALRRKIPFVISPHGCLMPWALAHKRMKKFVALKSYQGLMNRNAAMFIAASNQEVESIRRTGISRPIAILPNGVDNLPAPQRKRKEGKRSILFLSRIHSSKGLLDLVEAWASVRDDGWKIVIAGPDEEGHKSKVEAKIQSLRLETDFEFIGLVDGERKHSCFTNADLFVLPTYSENFGISVLEALSYELPVITTTAAPWGDLLEYKCGWWVPPGVAGISTALRLAMETSPTELNYMGRRGRELVMAKYTWDHIAQDALVAYEWMLNRNLARPEFVDFHEK